MHVCWLLTYEGAHTSLCHRIMEMMCPLPLTPLLSGMGGIPGVTSVGWEGWSLWSEPWNAQ